MITKQEAALLRRAEIAVLRAACAWVNYEDDGRSATTHKMGKLNTRLAGAVTRYERKLNRMKGSKK